MYITLPGLDTSGASLTTLILIMVNYPDIQHKIQQEINTVVGNSRRPGLADRPNMPYTEATLMEVMRYMSATPNGVIRKTTKDTEVQGHRLPKDTPVCASLNMATNGSVLSFR